MAAMFVAIVAIVLRQLRDEPAGTTVFYFTVLTLPFIAVPYAFHVQGHSALIWAVLASIGVVGGLAQLALTAASRLAPVTAVVPMDYTGLIWATVYGWAMFGVLPASTTWAGAPLIIASGLFIVWREQRLGKRQTISATAED